MSVLSTLLNAKRLCKHTCRWLRNRVTFFLFCSNYIRKELEVTIRCQHSIVKQPKLCDPTFQVPKSSLCSEKSVEASLECMWGLSTGRPGLIWSHPVASTTWNHYQNVRSFVMPSMATLFSLPESKTVTDSMRVSNWGVPWKLTASTPLGVSLGPGGLPSPSLHWALCNS